jgi:hypothetical protein
LTATRPGAIQNHRRDEETAPTEPKNIVQIQNFATKTSRVKDSKPANCVT